MVEDGFKPRTGSTRVAIIGSGFSGIAAAVALQRRGIHDYVILEQASGVGGTWWKNRYPGAEVDLESHIYSFSFAHEDWDRTHATREQLQRYLERVADEHGLTPKLRLNERVTRVEWQEATDSYRILTASGIDHGEFTAVISAVGFLNIPLMPPFARGESPFRGAVCHTADWPEGLDMAGKVVGVVGTGSSAAQMVPEAEKVASQVKVFQREANWIIPKKARAFGGVERWLLRRRLGYILRRWWLYGVYDRRQMFGRHALEGKRPHAKRERIARAHLEESLAGEPKLMKDVTPDDVFEGRRAVLSDTYYDALRSEKVELIPHSVAELTARGVRDDAGSEYDLDMIVLATGFDAANYLGNYEVVGRDGIELHQRWGSEPEAFLGIMVPGFPNFFIMYGPNTNSVPLVSFYEAQAGFAARLLKRMERRGRTTVEVRESAFRRYNVWLQRWLGRTVWSRTHNYFRASTGKVVSQWPFSATVYILALRIAEHRAMVLGGARRRGGSGSSVAADDGSADRGVPSPGESFGE
ncbi:MAG TPA: NAD(P)/FAD-dependent oxidoreductase [Solirubrobacterales bacterium]